MTMTEWITANLTLVIAAWGAVLSTVGIIWKVYSDLQNKAKVKVDASFAVLAGHAEAVFQVTAKNEGRRPITLSSLGVRSGNNDLINVWARDLPHELKEGASHTEWFELKELEGKDWDFAWYRDALGKLHKSKSIRKKLHNYFNSENKKDLLAQEALNGDII